MANHRMRKRSARSHRIDLAPVLFTLRAIEMRVKRRCDHTMARSSLAFHAKPIDGKRAIVFCETLKGTRTSR